MNAKDTILDYLESRLSESERETFEEALQQSADLRREVEQYRELLQLESHLAEQQFEPGAGFEVKLMQELERGSFIARLYGRYVAVSRKVLIPLGGVAVVVLAVLVGKESFDPSKFAKVSRLEGNRLQDAAPAPAEKVVDESSKGAKPEQDFFHDPDAVKERLAIEGEVDEERFKEFALSFDRRIGEGEQQRKELYEVLDETKRDTDEHKQRVTGVFELLVDKFEQLAREVDLLSTAMKAQQETPPLPADMEAAPDELEHFGFDGRRQGSSRTRYPARRQGDKIANVTQSGLNSIAPAPSAVARANSQAPSQATGFTEAKRGVAGNTSATKAESTEYAEEMDSAVGALVSSRNPAPGEHYGHYEENRRIRVSEEPRSTFSLDVDTGSYSNARRFLRLGQLPPADAVRVEEFINYFDYDYPEQYEKPFSVHYEVAPSPFSAGRHLLKVGVKARDIASTRSTPWNLVFLIDVSGSMSDSNKLPLVQSSLKFLLSQMKPQDRIALVTYADGSEVVLDSTPASEQQVIAARIDNLRAAGGTNGSGGIQKAYEIARKNRINGGVNRVILATDGDFNVGISDFDGLMAMIEAKRREGTTLTTLGFGAENYQEENLEQLANRGNGNYYYVDSFEQAKRIFSKGLTGAMEVVAKDVKVQVEFNPAQVLEYRLLGYDNRLLRNRDFHDDRIDAGEIGSGHTVTAFYEVVLNSSELATKLQDELRYQQERRAEPSQAAEHGDELAFVKLRFKAPESEQSTVEGFGILVDQVRESFDAASSDFRFAAAVAGFAALLRNSVYAEGFSFGTLEQIARNALKQPPTAEQQEFLGMMSSAAALRGEAPRQPRSRTTINKF